MAYQLTYNTPDVPGCLAGIRLAALDLDGTLFNDQGEITPATLDVIRRLNQAGTQVVISTGRPFSGVPFRQIEGTGIDIALTTNGAAIYRISDRSCLSEQTMPDGLILPVLEYLLSKNVHVAAFINGDGISPSRCHAMVSDLILPESVKYTLNTTRVHVDDLLSYIRENHLHVQKVTVNFMKAPDGHLLERDEVASYLSSLNGLQVVCGGYEDQEITLAGVDKGVGLRHLAEVLNIPMEQTMAVGDTENDLAILNAAGVSVAMANAAEMVKQAADIVTASNNEDGVAIVLQEILNKK